jgi:hypothetical protein
LEILHAGLGREIRNMQHFFKQKLDFFQVNFHILSSENMDPHPDSKSTVAVQNQKTGFFMASFLSMLGCTDR